MSTASLTHTTVKDTLDDVEQLHGATSAACGSIDSHNGACRLSEALTPRAADRFFLMSDALAVAAMEAPTNSAGINVAVSREMDKAPGEGLQANQQHCHPKSCVHKPQHGH